MSLTSRMLRVIPCFSQQSRSLLRPPRNLPFRGVYRTDGESVRKDDILLCQGSFNYHPGLNVSYVNERGEKVLTAMCDGTVRISRELVDPDWSQPEMSVYEHRKDVPIYKLTFNVVPQPMSQKFNLVKKV